MRDHNFDRLLHRYLHNELTPEEQVKFTAWLDLLRKEEDGDLELSDEAKDTLFQKITNNMSTVDDVLALYPRKPFVQRVLAKRWVQVAAMVLIMLSATFAVRDYIQKYGPITQLAGDTGKMILNDGTIVWLKQGATFAYYEKDNARFANFSGEALFEIARDPDRLFTITCGSIDVKVIGTSFTLKADRAGIELNVLTGKVNVTSASDHIGIDVAPNEKVIYSSGGLVESTMLADRDRASLIANTEYNMKFQAAPMAEVIERIAGKFDVTFDVKNKELNECHISADFTDHSLEGTLSILTDLLAVSYTIRGKHIELSGKGC
jgi:ferric-dicitrate binding protein FerR (iron transport regulator)